MNLLLCHRAFRTLLVAVLAAGSSAMAVDNLWTGAISSDWNNDANWSDPHGFGSPHVPNNGAGHPGDEDAVINSTPPNIATITANTVVKPRDNKVGLGAGTNGRVDHTAGFHSTGGGNWTFVGEGGGTGRYNLANTSGTGGTYTGFGVGSGSYSTLGEQFRIGAGLGSVGTFNMNTTGTLVSDRVYVGLESGNGTFNMDGGTWNNARSFMVGEAAGVGLVNQSGGVINVAGDWFGIGYGGGGPAGSRYNMTGGQLNITPITEIGADRVGVMEMSANAVLDTNTADFVVGLRAGGNGTLTMIDNAQVTAAGSNSFVGRDLNSIGTINLGGNASIAVNGITIGENGAGFVNQTGGTFTSNNWFTVGGANIPGGAFSKYTGTGGSVAASVVEVGMRRQGEMEVSGTATITATSTLFIGHEGNGAGLLTQLGGTITAGGSMLMGRNGGVSATYNHTGGTLNVNALEMGNGATTPVFSTTADLNVGPGAVTTGETHVQTSVLLVGGTMNVGGDLNVLPAGSIELGSSGNLNVNNGTTPGNAGAGNINVTGGLATIDGTITRTALGGGAVNVGAGGTLEGSGSIAGPVNIMTGGTIEPGTSAGILDTGTFSLASDAHLTIEIGGLVAGTGYDQVSATGSVSLAGDLDGSTFINGFESSIQPGNTFYIVLNDDIDPVLGTFFDGAIPIPDGGGVVIGGVPFTVSYNENGDLGLLGNDVALIAVPEPASLAALLAGLSLVALRRRRC